MKKCPYCAEYIQEEAIYCRYCKSDLSSKEEVQHPNKSKNRNTLGTVLIVAGGILGELYALSLVASEWGLAGAIAAFLFFPVAITVAPIYALFVYGAWLPLVIVYGIIGLGVLINSQDDY